MATPPTLVTYVEGASWDTSATPKTSTTFNVSAGDILAALTGDENDHANEVYTTSNSVTAQTWTKGSETTGTTDGDGWAQAATAVAGAAITGTAISVDRIGGSPDKFNFGAFQFSGSAGVGAGAASTAGNTAAPSLSITTTANNSAIACLFVDWTPKDATTRTWRTVNSITPTAANGYEKRYFRNATNYTVLVAYYPDAGAAGAKTVGLSAPTGAWRWVGVAVEIKSASTGDATVTAVAATTSAAGTVAPTLQASSAVAGVVGTSTAASAAPVAQASSTVLAYPPDASASVRTATLQGFDVTASSNPTSVAATANADAAAPGVTVSVTITSVVATASASAPAPAVAGDAGTVIATTATATAASPVPTLTADATAAATASTATAQAQPPSVSTFVTIQAVVATASAAAAAPTPTASAEATVGGPSTATANVRPPVVVGGAGVTAVAAPASASTPAPSVAGDGAAVVRPAACAATASAPAPGIHASQTITSVPATATATAIPAVNIRARYAFEPPTFEAPMLTSIQPLRYFRETYAASVVRIGGAFTSVRSPSADVLDAAGINGRDYFLGGHVYDDIDSTTASQLRAAGYTVT